MELQQYFNDAIINPSVFFFITSKKEIDIPVSLIDHRDLVLRPFGNLFYHFRKIVFLI